MRENLEAVNGKPMRFTAVEPAVALVLDQGVYALNDEHAFGLKFLGSEIKVHLREPGHLANLFVGQPPAFRFVTQNPQQRQCRIFVYLLVSFHP